MADLELDPVSEEALLAAIYAQPDEDGPRLAYAGWLEEHGQPERAEFIRFQCRLAGGEPPGVGEEDRLWDLREQHREAWAAHLPQQVGASWHFRRGLPEELEIELAVLLDRYADWSVLPRVRYLRLCNVTARLMEAFAGRAWNPDWVGLEFAEEPRPWLHGLPYDPPSISPVVGSPQAARLRELRFCGYCLGEGGIQALCESPHLDRLSILMVDREYFADSRLVERFGPRLQTRN